MSDDSSDARMSLFEHLAELRSRLMRVTLSVVVLGAAAFVFAKPIFGVLMKPVLDALPPDGKSLIYTSGVEEINVLMKVGFYAGIFLTTPVLLWQIWGFVSPGLYPQERKFAGPFVLLGTTAFLAGSLFCYFVILPQMFEFLLREGDSAAIEQQLEMAALKEREAVRLLSIGEVTRAGELARSANASLTTQGTGALDMASLTPSKQTEWAGRMDGLGRLFDALALSEGRAARPVLATAMEGRTQALALVEEGGPLSEASQKLDEVAAALAAAVPSGAEQFQEIWSLEKNLASGRAYYDALRWTRPMLTMREQLSLVLILLLALGIIFELPIVMALLARLGVVRASFLMKYQRHAIVVCLIAAALITPTGDALNLMLLAGPMILCYEVGVLAAWLIERQRAKAEATTTLVPRGD